VARTSSHQDGIASHIGMPASIRTTISKGWGRCESSRDRRHTCGSHRAVPCGPYRSDAECPAQVGGGLGADMFHAPLTFGADIIVAQAVVLLVNLGRARSGFFPANALGS
jgi:hypothetical protein